MVGISHTIASPPPSLLSLELLMRQKIIGDFYKQMKALLSLYLEATSPQDAVDFHKPTEFLLVCSRIH